MKLIAQIILLIIFIWFYFDTFGFLEGVVIGFLLLIGAIANSKSELRRKYEKNIGIC